MTRRILLWTLLALVPLMNIRMICIDHGGRVSSTAVSAGSGCDETCPREKPAEPESGCLLVAGGCSAMMAFVVALPVPAVVIAAPAATIRPSAEPRVLYLSPLLGTFSPPPKA